jgi:flagellar hook-length control protein FliK
MLESKNILLDIGRASTAAPATPAGPGNDATGKNPEQFSALLGDAAASLKAAKSGNSMPLSEQPQKQGAEFDSAAVLSSRTLKGGMALIVGGSEPTDAGLIAFARAQGMDPKSLGLLTSTTGQVANSTLLEQGVAVDAAVSMSSTLKGSELNNGLATPDATNAPVPILLSQQAMPAEHKLAHRALQIGLPEAAAKPGAAKPELQLAVPSDKFLTDQQRLQRAQGNQPAATAGLPSGQQTLKAAVEAAINAQAATAKPGNPQAGNAQANNTQANNTQTNNTQTIPQSLAQQAAMTAAKASSSGPVGDVNTLDIKPKNAITSVKLSATVAAVEPQAQTSQLEAAKVTVGPKMAEAFLKQHRDRQNLPVTKMDSISLVENKLLTGSSPSALATGPLASAAVAPMPLFVDGQATSSTAQASLNADLSSETPAENARQDALRRQDDYMQLSRQLTEALGKRLTAQIQRGSWHVEMDLHPKSLGRVEVQLEMKNGELEARFIAANATTRDLINEGMPRLREALQEHGTETASMDLGSAHQGASDGNSTAAEERAEGSKDRLSAEVDNDSPKAGQSKSADGLDVHV